MIWMTLFSTNAIRKMHNCVETLLKMSFISSAIRYLHDFSSRIDQDGMKETGLPIKSMIFERCGLFRKIHMMGVLANASSNKQDDTDKPSLITN